MKIRQKVSTYQKKYTLIIYLEFSSVKIRKNDREALSLGLEACFKMYFFSEIFEWTLKKELYF